MDTATLCRDILNTARNELYLSMRFLDAALSGLSHEASPRIRATATDGEKLYYSSRYVLSAFDENPVILNRAYLHNLCHCLFSHLYLQPRENRDLWDLACDVCAESVIDSMDIPCVRRLPSLLREQTYDLLSRKLRLYTPGRLYEIFEKDVFFRQNLAALIQDFCIDTHEFWPEDAARNRSRQKSRQEEQWREIGSRTRTRMETFHRQAGDEAGNLLMHLKLSYGETLTYDRFLARFACWREVVTLNPEEFDAIYYTLGLERYGNIPLIEPLEYREEKKIQSLVLAVDTSGSVRGAPVKRFLSETFSILASSKHFFRHMQIHLLQFDTRVQDARLIQSASELPALADSFAVRGFGGTDYRCVFDYTDRLEGGVQGLLILTDGYGTYPARRPAYPAAFLLADFLKEYDQLAPVPAYGQVPDWAISFSIAEGDLISRPRKETQKEGEL